MIKPGIDNLIKWITNNGLIRWSISTKESGSDNARIFESNPEASREAELERMRTVLELSTNANLYVFGAVKEGKTVGNFSERWNNIPDGEAVAGLPPVQQVQQPVVVEGTITKEELEIRIKKAIEEYQFKLDKIKFEEEKKEFRAEKKEFDDFKNGAIGQIIERAMPYLGKIMPLKPQQPVAAVAGVGNTVVNAVPVQPVAAQGKTGGVEEVFTDEEGDKLYELMAKYKEFDRDNYLQVLEKLVTIATEGKPIVIMNGMVKLTYTEIRDMLLNME